VTVIFKHPVFMVVFDRVDLWNDLRGIQPMACSWPILRTQC